MLRQTAGSVTWRKDAEGLCRHRADPTTRIYHETTKPPGWGAGLGAVGRFTVRNRRGCCSDTLLQITGVDKINALKEGAVDLGVRRDQHFVDQCF